MFIPTKRDIDRYMILETLELPTILSSLSYSLLFQYITEDDFWKIHRANDLAYYDSEDDYVKDIKFFLCQNYHLDEPVFDKIWQDEWVKSKSTYEDMSYVAQHLCKLVSSCLLERKNIEN